MTGQTVSHYRILEKLGGGGMSVAPPQVTAPPGTAEAIKAVFEKAKRDPD